jgi:hypothetical protein
MAYLQWRNLLILQISYLRKLSTTPAYEAKFEKEIYLPNASYFNRSEAKMKEAQQNARNMDEKENIPKLIRNFLGYTTAHGFSRLEGSKGVFWKVFWSVVCLGSFGMFVYQVHGLFELYLSRPVTTSVRITFEKVRMCLKSWHYYACPDKTQFKTNITFAFQQVPFPAVTICNLNMLRTKKIPKELKEEMLKLVSRVYNQSSATSECVFLLIKSLDV